MQVHVAADGGAAVAAGARPPPAVTAVMRPALMSLSCDLRPAAGPHIRPSGDEGQAYAHAPRLRRSGEGAT